MTPGVDTCRIHRSVIAMKEFHVKNLVNPEGITGDILVQMDGGIITSARPWEGTPVGPVFPYAVPGFIDMHLHGSGGFDVMDGSGDALSGLGRALLEKGTTSYCGTTMTAPVSELERVLSAGEGFVAAGKARACQGLESSFLGFHLEGPWISDENAGAQDPAYIAAPDRQSFDLISDYADILAMVTVSYHRDLAPFLDHCREKKIITAAGHDDTPDYEIREGFNRGISHITHIYCSTSSFMRRNRKKHLGTLEMGLMTDGITVEVIADNHHITRYFWDFIRHNKKVDDIILVSDSIRAAGIAADGVVFSAGGVDAVIEDGVAWRVDREFYAGSVVCMHDMFRILVNQWGVSLEDAVRVTSWNQAKKLGLDNELGRLAPGMRGDMLLLDENLNLEKIVINGIVTEPEGVHNGNV